MMNERNVYLALGVVSACLFAAQAAMADVERRGSNDEYEIVSVSDDPWQPEGFVNGTTVPATWIDAPSVEIDGDAGDDAWKAAKEVEVPLRYGAVDKAWIKAVYTDEEVFIQVRWADPTEDRDHHPWVWDSNKKRYVEGRR